MLVNRNHEFQRNLPDLRRIPLYFFNHAAEYAAANTIPKSVSYRGLEF
jgi:hypothetical protein